MKSYEQKQRYVRVIKELQQVTKSYKKLQASYRESLSGVHSQFIEKQQALKGCI